jgi:hypothetical protein
MDDDAPVRGFMKAALCKEAAASVELDRGQTHTFSPEHDDQKCARCGYARRHHRRMNDYQDLCDAIRSRVPLVYCDCLKFKAVM